MALIHHVLSGTGPNPVVFIHGFGCDHTDWDAQVTHLAPSHTTVAVDLPGHGASQAQAVDCSIEQYGAAVAKLLRALRLPPAMIVGHSLGCRVAVEVALQAPEHAKSVTLVDGSQFAAVMGPVLRDTFTRPDGFATLTQGMFVDMFGPKADTATRDRVVARAVRLPRDIGETMLLDLQRYDVTRWTASLSCLRIPVFAIQTTYANEKRERLSLNQGQTSPYLDMLRSACPQARIEIIEGTGHFPQLEEAARTNALLDGFLDARV